MKERLFINIGSVSRKNTIHLILILFLLLSFSCSTKKNTALTRFYHGLTTKYNILFNGSESFKEGKTKYEDAYEDDYSQVLPVFVYGEEEIAAGIKPQMDRTIDKSTKSIRLHSITKKPQEKDNMSEKDKQFYNKNEYNIFIDDAYLLMGKAFFYQSDYASAIRIFNFIIKQYDDEKTKYMAYNWLVRSNVEIKDFREAQNLIDFLVSDMDYPEKLNYELNRTIADFYLKQQQFTQAEPYVAEALELVRKKKQKIRLTFIYAQLNEELGNYNVASDLYESVIKMNPSYEMAFNAKIKRATLFTGGKSIKSIEVELLKMLKDDKNIDYQDQIYYALGELEMKNMNINQAIAYYQLSASTNISNTNQKGLTYLALANIFFDRTEYTESQAYFDSAVVSLDPDFPGYIELARKNRYLSKLVKNLRIVETQDSLQMVAQMPEKERDLFIQQIIQNIREKEAEERERQRNEETRDLNDLGRSTRPSTSIDQGGKWYFYNPSAKSFGQPEFRRRWGNRKLEDNWRRKNKQMMGVEQIAESDFSDEVIDNKAGLDNKSPDYYMVDLPLTDSAMVKSHEKIQTALFNVGEVYKNDLKEYSMAIDAYKDLIERYPESEYKVPAYYNLYKVYRDKGDLAQSEVYRNMIIRNYPETKYAKVLLDPNYFKQFEEEEKERKEYYAQTLELYKQKKFSNVIRRCNVGLNKYNEPEYLPKYSYLRALAMGEVYGVTVLKSELEKVIENYKTDPVSNEAENLLASIKQNELKSLKDINIAEKTDTTTGAATPSDEVVQKTMAEIEKMYSYMPETKHYVAIVIDKNANINQLKFNIINFNLDFFIEKSYDIENKELNEFFTIVTIKQFKNAKESLAYSDKFKSELQRIFNDVETSDYQTFVISEKNLETLMDEKMVRDYLLFYNKNYQE
ncbi:MAG: tetratricopeptide repeat protein [Bacteroidetes bacterium]|nr:tetratricopeptide repeat protein [Bacteroidota bacterium]